MAAINDQLSRRGIRFSYTDYLAFQEAEKTAVTIKRPFSVRFAYWAGFNGKSLLQRHRIDDAAAAAWAQGWQDAADQNK